MQNLSFPLQLSFKISTLANDFTARDASGHIVAYVRQKIFKLKADIQIYADESKSKLNYEIKANKWLDFSLAYSFFDTNGTEFGKIVRKGWRSIWKATYELVDQNSEIKYHLREENAWVKVMDALLGEIPILGMFSGYLFNPSYIVTNNNEEILFRLKKKPSFWGKEFEINKLMEVSDNDDDLIMLGCMMMILNERRRG